METLKEDEAYNWSEVKLPSLRAAEASGRDIVIAVDHGPKSKLAFDWALNHLCRQGDTYNILRNPHGA